MKKILGLLVLAIALIGCSEKENVYYMQPTSAKAEIVYDSGDIFLQKKNTAVCLLDGFLKFKDLVCVNSK